MRAHPTLDQLRQLEIFGMAGAFGEASATPRRSAMPTGSGLLPDREVDPSPRQALGRPPACAMPGCASTSGALQIAPEREGRVSSLPSKSSPSRGAPPNSGCGF